MKTLFKMLNLNSRDKNQQIAAISIELERFQKECTNLKSENEKLACGVKKLEVKFVKKFLISNLFFLELQK